MEKCFVCDKPVIGIDGLETTLDTFMLNGQEGESVLASESFGCCHMACLAVHSSGAAWAALLQRHFKNNLKYREHADSGPFVVLERGRAEEFFLVRHDGPHLALTPLQYSALKYSTGQYLILRMQGMRRVELCHDRAFNAWLGGCIQSRAAIDLALLYSSLGVVLPDDAWKFQGSISYLGGPIDEITLEAGFAGEVSIDLTILVPNPSWGGLSVWNKVQ